MTAFSREDSNKTFQRVAMSLRLNDSSPGIQAMFKALKSHLSQMKGNPQLQFVAFTDAQLIAGGGIQLGTGVGKLHAVYVKKNGTSGTGTATASVVKLQDDATDDTTAGTQRIALYLKAANDERVYMDPDGLSLANGLNANADTSLLGTTDSTAGDAGNGFVIIS